MNPSRPLPSTVVVEMAKASFNSVPDFPDISDLVPFGDFDISAYMTFDLDDLNFDFIPTEPTSNPAPAPKPTSTGTSDLPPSTYGSTPTTTSPTAGTCSKCSNVSKGLQKKRRARIKKSLMPHHAKKFDKMFKVIEVLQERHGRAVPVLKELKRQLVCFWPISAVFGDQWYHDRFRRMDETVAKFVESQTPPQSLLQLAKSLQKKRKSSPNHKSGAQLVKLVQLEKKKIKSAQLKQPEKKQPKPANSKQAEKKKSKTTTLKEPKKPKSKRTQLKQLETQNSKSTPLKPKILSGAAPVEPMKNKQLSLAITNTVKKLTLLKIEGELYGENPTDKLSKEKMEAELNPRRSRRQLVAKVLKAELKRAEEVKEQQVKKLLTPKQPQPAVMRGKIEEKLIIVDNRPRMLFRRQVPFKEEEIVEQTPAPTISQCPERQRKRKQDVAPPSKSSGTAASESQVHKKDEVKGTEPHVPIPATRKRKRATKKKGEKEPEAQ